MNPHLILLGLLDCYLEDIADFSGISDDKTLYISSVYHKAVIEVFEEGTRAAAASAVVMDEIECCVIPPKIIHFNCNKPFIFIINSTEDN